MVSFTVVGTTGNAHAVNQFLFESCTGLSSCHSNRVLAVHISIVLDHTQCKTTTVNHNELRTNTFIEVIYCPTG